jgi:hypothetical protein
MGKLGGCGLSENDGSRLLQPRHRAGVKRRMKSANIFDPPVVFNPAV